MTYEWRAMTTADLPQMMRIAAQLHAGYFESDAVLSQRLALYAAGCLAAVHPDDPSSVLGYAIMHPARLGTPPPLNSLLPGIPDDADALHLHDVALLPPARGCGLVPLLAARMQALAQRHRLAHTTLIAVHGSAAYWRTFGFDVVPVAAVNASLLARLATYGDHAVYMSRQADGARQ